MKKTLWGPLLGWLICHASPGYAEGNGHDLLRQCTQAVNVMDGTAATNAVEFMAAGRCMGLVDGFAGAAAFYESQPGAPGAICFPEDTVTLGQSVRLVTQFLEDNPQQLHETSTVLIFGAFLASFPCG